jgi:plasmid stabilization system protein ParE
MPRQVALSQGVRSHGEQVPDQSESQGALNVVITEVAEADLERIGDWIAADNPERALTFVLELRDKCEALATCRVGIRRCRDISMSGYGGERIEIT